MNDSINRSSGSHSGTPNTNKFILRYSGRCITFNLVQVTRVKKDGMTISGRWDNEDEDNFLIVRLIESNGSPWLVAHHGIYEVVKGPSFVPVTKCSTNYNTVCIFLRDHANRGDTNCIQREFQFKFDSLNEADFFLFAHNSFVETKQRGNKVESTVRTGVGANSASTSSSSMTTQEKRRNSAFHRKRYTDLSSSEEEEKEDRKGSLAPSILRGSREKRRRMDHDGRGGGRKENKKAQTKLKNDCNQNGK